jgi:histidyl-tRNA synthetase
LLELKGENVGFLRNLKTIFGSSLPEFMPVLDNFIEIVDLLTVMGVKYQIEIASGRGFEYYTGIIFQMFDGEIKLGGGGRYDALIPLMGGKNTPASGFMLLMNHLMKTIEMPLMTEQETAKVLVTVAGSQPKLMKSAYRMTKRLREAGFIVSIQVDNEEQADFKWIVEIMDKSPVFVIRNLSNKSKLTAETIEDVIKLLGGKGGN